jgi:hypothetical protein
LEKENQSKKHIQSNKKKEWGKKLTQKQKQNDWKAQPNSSEHDKSTIRVVKINYPHRKQINKEAQFLINPILNDKFF